MFKKLSCLALCFVFAVTVWAENIQTVMSYYRPEMSKGFIFISKADLTLTVVDSKGQIVVTYPVACGRNIGPKTVKGDNKTPEGYFSLQRIHDSSGWGHNFHDGKGFIKHAYGPYFLRLKTGFDGIGIHGTHAPESIGTRATEGCIRLENSNIAKLERQVVIGMPVIIGPEEGVDFLVNKRVPRPVRPVVAKAAVERPLVKPVPERLVLTTPPTIVDGHLDIDPENDLKEEELLDASADEVIADAIEEVIADKAEEPVVIETPVIIETPAVIEAPTVVETPAIVETPAMIEAEEPKLEEPKAIEPEIPMTAPGKRARTPYFVKDETKEPVTEQAAPPKYEVVVVEVTTPEGETKYEVQYKRIE